MSDFLRTVVQKLNGDNYSVWSKKIELLLIREDLWEVVKEEPPTPEDSTWAKKDNRARATIGLLIEDNQLVHIEDATTAKEAWEKLKQHHQKASRSNIIYLYKKLFKSALPEDGNMEEHISEILTLINKLTALGEVLKDHLRATILLSSLPDSYSALITSLESRSETDFTLDFVKGRLIDEYSRRKDNKISEKNEESALKVNHKQNFQGKDRETRHCFFCKKPNHVKKECFKYKKWKEKQDKEDKANKVSECLDEFNEFCKLVREEHSDQEIKGKTCLSASEIKSDKDCWYVDSGATSHMTTSKDTFDDYDPSVKGFVQLADSGKSCEVKGKGSGTIKCIVDGYLKEIKIHNVLYVPSLSSNLLSVIKLTKEGYSLNFEENSCKVIKEGKVQAVAYSEIGANGLYKIKTDADKACIVKNKLNGKHGTDCQHVWHRILGHRDLQAIKDLSEKGLAVGISVKDCGIQEVCECCVKGKMARKPFPKESQGRTMETFDLLHTDVCGPIQTVTPSKKRYIITIIDDYSRYSTVRFMEHKNEAGNIIKQFVEMVKTQFNKTPKCIRSDRGKEYVNQDLQNYLKNKGVKLQYTVSYSPQQNGVAERKNRSLLEMARCMMLDANLEKKYWAETVNTANFLQNRLPTRITAKTPYELMYSNKPDLKNLHIFGCDAYAQIPKELRRKLDDKAEKLTFIGYSEESKGFRLLDKKTDRIKVSRDVIFLDKNQQVKNSNEAELIISEEKFSETTEEDKIDNNISETESSSSDDQNDTQPTEPRRSRRINKGVPPERFMASSNLATQKINDPKSRNEALSGSNNQEWQKAMDEEISSLSKNKTWDIVPAPEDRDIVTCKWIFKSKQNQEGKTTRYKTRLVARGFSQKYGTDYDEVFAPVVRQTTFKILLAIAGQENLIIKHYDAKTAFLNGDLDQTIYMTQPEGYEIFKDNVKLVCKLKKGLYGLKQSAKLWNEKLNSILLNFKFLQSQTDSCFYIKRTKENVIFVIIHVDDFLIASKSIEKINETAEFLKGKFQLLDLGFLHCYLGIEVRRNSDGIYCIKQSQYIDNILKRFGLEDAKISNIPLDPGYIKIDKEDQPIMEESEKYQQLIGALLYLAVNTRPDITASVIILSQNNKHPTSADWTETKRIGRYLKGTRDYELILGQRGKEEGLVGYADADWAENRKDRKSNSGYLFKYLNATISWGCRKQTCVALSSTEAEYIALAEACQECIWIRRLLEDFLNYKQGPTTIFEDNQSCLKFLSNKKFSHRTKHIDTKFHFVKQLKENRTLNFEYCPTDRMLADMLTKPLSRIKLRTLAEGCGLTTQSSVHHR
ncbi:uncharacterized protein LOC127282958 [Leptopilina boulardi]|uniref:uncharacterized protein LOC127282958 n=1 Tax=Leptopilina boulardi TaxID=63433 RepID=UPI0021F5F21F|nr:uncharacterized protein LOC127282958 [Leptopilina boulardi]